MSLLIDARKKSQLTHNAKDGGSSLSVKESGFEHPDSAYPSASPVTPSPDNRARIAGQNLFKAKSPAPSFSRARINRHLLIALGGTVLLFTMGAGYVWYIAFPGNTQPSVPVNKPAAASLSKPAPVSAPPKNNIVPEIISTKPAYKAQLTHTAQPTAKAPQARQTNSVQVEQHQDEPIDPLLNNAYLAYRNGKFDESQQLYHAALKLDERNIDAILGLAVIAQRRGADSLAAHYYAQALAIDPRNAVANAGMSALSTDDNRESRLKTLLNEQQDSSSLHFALGNYYAGLSRWGEAQQAYFNAFRLEPDNAELTFNLAISLDRLGQNKSAAQYYQHALQLDPKQSSGFDHAQISQRIKALTR